MAAPHVTPPQTITATNHGLVIRVSGLGLPVGAIHSWSPNMTRAIFEVYQFGDDVPQGKGLSLPTGPGEPYEKVPGNVSGMTITVDRYDLFTNTMEQAFGTVDLSMLSKQSSPFIIDEFINQPAGGVRQNQYQGCWFSRIGRTHSATDDRIIKVNAELHYTRKITVSIGTG